MEMISAKKDNFFDYDTQTLTQNTLRIKPPKYKPPPNISPPKSAWEPLSAQGLYSGSYGIYIQ